MIQFSDAQLNAWLAAYLYPLVRILGLFATAPVFNNASLPVRIRLLAGITVAVALAPALPPPAAVDPGSWSGLALLIQELLIGLALGFTMRIVFAGIDLAGELIGLQMGLGFALFYDPDTAGQTPVIAEFIGLLTLLLFLSLDGHLVLLALLAKSFSVLPIGQSPFPAGWSLLLYWVGALFSFGVLLALPVIGALLVANIALGILTKVAPTLNLFAVGFPVTLMAGFLLIGLALPHFAPSMEKFFVQGYEAIERVMGAALPAGAPAPAPAPIRLP